MYLSLRIGGHREMGPHRALQWTMARVPWLQMCILPPQQKVRHSQFLLETNLVPSEFTSFSWNGLHPQLLRMNM